MENQLEFQWDWDSHHARYHHDTETDLFQQPLQDYCWVCRGPADTILESEGYWCSRCGLKLDVHIADALVPQERDHGWSAAKPSFTSYADPPPLPVKRYQATIQRLSKRVTALCLSQVVIDCAARAILRAHELNTHGATVDAACMWMACEEKRSTTSLEDVCRVFATNKRVVAKMLRSIKRMRL